jgi:uncharacterized phage-associated protein
VFRVWSVAKELVRLSFAGDEKDPLTNLRLQKLLYYAQAWSLVLRESELFPEDIEAWRWGPVVPTVYNQLPDGQGAIQIPPTQFFDAPDLPPEDAELVRSVWEAYNQYSALQLSRMTHQETPWLRAWGNRPTDGTGSDNDPIEVDDLEEYFGKQAVPAPLAAYHYELRKREEEAERILAGFPRLDPSLLRTASKSYTPAAKVQCGAGD